ncbi:hypothetical protein RI543_002141 [Arxiozyma heterogenica]|uniref:Uncharacterized protein n=1 Tax=Arxiozyma heterogenica TaxID=278026 RepID=A0AAN7WMD1_9SACH|nr:hypothetical protein RI543_002141 [Kazachstania heterogenica]
MVSPRIYEAVNELLDSNYATPQWEIDKYLKTLYSISNRHGIPTDLLPNLLNFLFYNTVVSINTRLKIIRRNLLPNDYISNEVFHFIIVRLGNAKDNNIDKNIQCAICKWLLNVYFLFPERILDSDKSILIYLWKYEYLQRYITYFIVWSTNTKYDIKLWKLNMLDKASKKPVYSSSDINLTLILKRYLTLLGKSEVLSNLLQKKINSGRLQKLQDLQALEFDDKFSSKLINVLSRENPNKFGIDIIKKHQNMLLDMLKDSETHTNTLRYDRRKLRNSLSPLYEVKNISQLQKNWTKLKLPINVETLFMAPRHNPVIQFYPMVVVNNPKYNSKKEQKMSKVQYLYSLNSWVEVNLKRCFNDITMLDEEKTPIIKTIIFNCQIFDDLQMTAIDTFLTLENLLSNENIVIILIMSLFPILKPPINNFLDFRNKILKFLAICHLTYNDQRNKNGNSKVFPLICSALLSMTQNWFLTYPNDHKITDFAFILLADIRKLILANMKYSIEDRFLSMTLIKLVTNLTEITPMYKTISSGTALHFDKLVLNRDTIHKMVLLDDPLILNACCKYLIKMTDVLINHPQSGKFIELQNQYILDITNYLWRNKIMEKRKLFNIPTEFLKQILDNCFFPGVKNKDKAVFTITGIPAMSFISIKALEVIEKKEYVKYHYDRLLTEEDFALFKKYITETNIEWMSNEIDLVSLKISILKEIFNMQPYNEIAKFLFAFLKSLSKYNHADK